MNVQMCVPVGMNAFKNGKNGSVQLKRRVGEIVCVCVCTCTDGENKHSHMYTETLDDQCRFIEHVGICKCTGTDDLQYMYQSLI